MSFNLTYMGHASFLLESDKAAILMDPWYSPYGAFMGAWRQFPPLRDHEKFIKNKSKDKDIYCFISHNHQDHLDLSTLKNLNSYIKKYLIVNFDNKSFKEILKEVDSKK